MIKNYTIISLYSSLFMTISLLTAYFPLWLNKAMQLDPKHIGFIISLSGILKVFFSFAMANFIKNYKFLKLFLLTSIIFMILMFLMVHFAKDYLSFYILLTMILGFLIIFSPMLPSIETIYSELGNKSLNNYGKIRISGSISFCLGVFFFGYLLNSYSVSIFPLILVSCLMVLFTSVLIIPNNLKKNKYNNMRKFKKVIKDEKNILFFIIICSLIQGTHAMYYGYSTMLWERKGIDYLNIGILWSFAIISEIIIFLVTDHHFKKKFLFKALLFCSIIAAIRWGLNYFINSFYILLTIQTLHGVTFALTHYIMIYFINSKLKKSSRLYAQTLYYSLTSGIFITVLSITCGYFMSYFDGEIGFLLMSFLSLFGFLLLLIKRGINV